MRWCQNLPYASSVCRSYSFHCCRFNGFIGVGSRGWGGGADSDTCLASLQGVLASSSLYPLIEMNKRLAPTAHHRFLHTTPDLTAHRFHVIKTFFFSFFSVFTVFSIPFFSFPCSGFLIFKFLLQRFYFLNFSL